MPTDSTRCPGCGAQLQRSTRRGVRFECPTCGGRVAGLSPFEQMLQEGLGARVWVASSEGEPGVTCPFCGLPMRQPQPELGAPAGLAACHTCQEIWIPASAADWLAAHAAPGLAPAAPVEAPPAECTNCGAPFQPDEDGRCKYCHAQICAPTPIVFAVQETAPPPAAGGLLGALAAALNTPLE